MRSKIALITLFIPFLILIGSLEIHATVIEGGTIGSDTVWTDDDVHLVTSNVTVDSGITLTIEPGTIVKFSSGTRLSINQGILVAAGAEGNEIVFTSYRDDE